MLRKTQYALLKRIGKAGSYTDRNDAEFRSLRRLENQGYVEIINAVTRWRCEWILTEKGQYTVADLAGIQAYN